MIFLHLERDRNRRGMSDKCYKYVKREIKRVKIYYMDVENK